MMGMMGGGCLGFRCEGGIPLAPLRRGSFLNLDGCDFEMMGVVPPLREEGVRFHTRVATGRTKNLK